MFGTNPIRLPLKGDGSTLDVQEIFLTLQGEGPNAGRPSVFVRLGGCNLACSFCDTEFEQFAPMALENIVAEVERLAMHEPLLLVITGGEPFRQPIAPLCDAFLNKGYSVQIETNGTLYRPVSDAVQIVCSPKPGVAGYAPLREDLLAQTLALKFLVSEHDPLYESVPEVGQSGRDIAVYVQPMDEQDEAKNRANHQYAVALALKHRYRLSLQMHKLLGIP